MSRVEKRMIRQRRSRGFLQRALLFLSALVLVAGTAARLRKPGALQVTGVAAPSATPISAAYDETVETREITLGEVCWYAIQTGIYSDQASARTRAADYADRGAPGLVVEDGGKWRVFIACFGSKDDAAAVRDRLSDKQQVETYLYTWACPELRLRMTGKAGQLDVAEAGLMQTLQIAERLRNAAEELDTGSLTSSEAQLLLDDIDTQLQVWADTAAKRFDRPYPQLLAQELALVEAWKQQKAELEKAAKKGSTELSCALKLAAMSLYHQVIELRGSVVTS